MTATEVNEISQDGATYSIPRETSKIFRAGILDNPLIASSLPKEIEDCA